MADPFDLYIEPPPRELSQLERVEQRYIDELLRRDYEAEVILKQTYRKAARTLEPVWRDAYDFLEAARNNGATDEYLSGAIWHEHRLAGMLADAERLAAQALEPYGYQLMASNMDASQLAQQSFASQLSSALGATQAAQVVWDRLPANQLMLLTARLADGSPILQVAGRWGPGAANALQRAMIEGMSLGERPDDIAKRVANALGVKYGEVRTLTRTEMFRVYRSTNIATYRNNPQLVTGWRWKAALQTRTCPVCWAMHGTEHGLDEDFASHPLCRCTSVPILRKWGELSPLLANVKEVPPRPTGVALFDKLPKADKRAILGPYGALAYEKKWLKLADLVQETDSPIWGRGRQQRALRSVIGSDRLGIIHSQLTRARALGKIPKKTYVPPAPKLREPIKPTPKPKRAPKPVAQPVVTQPMAPDTWRANMSRAEANQWAMQGDLTRPLYHVSSKAGAEGITREGFDLSRSQWGRVWGNGAYMSDTSASELMYSAAFSDPTKIELRVFSRKTLRVDISGESGWGPERILRDVDPQAIFTYQRYQNELDIANDAIIPKLPYQWKAGDTYEQVQAGNKLNQVVRDAERAAGRYYPDVRAEAFTRTMQHYGYDALDLVDEPHRSSVGGSQVIVFDPKRVTVVREP
jgi:SPP1 gp7 family putative phage head morphogenesis protein